MSSDFLFSFDSPNSQRYTLGPVSFSINTVYIASMKLLFNQASLYPTVEDKENLTTALDIVDTLVATNKVPTYSESNEFLPEGKSETQPGSRKKSRSSESQRTAASVLTAMSKLQVTKLRWNTTPSTFRIIRIGCWLASLRMMASLAPIRKSARSSTA